MNTAGMDTGISECLPVWNEYLRLSGFGKLEAQRNVWDGIWTREEATSFLKKYSFVDSAMNSADFEQLSEDAGHFTSHDYSCEVVREYLEAKCGTVKGKWDMLTKMFQVPISMKGIANKTFDPYRFDIYR